jgi:hypothetical protein
VSAVPQARPRPLTQTWCGWRTYDGRFELVGGDQPEPNGDRWVLIAMTLADAQLLHAAGLRQASFPTCAEALRALGAALAADRTELPALPCTRRAAGEYLCAEAKITRVDRRWRMLWDGQLCAEMLPSLQVARDLAARVSLTAPGDAKT